MKGLNEPYSYDPTCEELADHFLQGSPNADRAVLAQVIQNAVEDWFGSQPPRIFNSDQPEQTTWSDKYNQEARTPGTQAWAETRGDDLGESHD